jgi:hypothetical protein
VCVCVCVCVFCIVIRATTTHFKPKEVERRFIILTFIRKYSVRTETGGLAILIDGPRETVTLWNVLDCHRKGISDDINESLSYMETLESVDRLSVRQEVSEETETRTRYGLP